VRDVLVNYLLERQPSVDFSSLQRLAYLLGKLFWADLEAHHPGIDSLQLPRDVAAAWKQRVLTRTRTRTSPDQQRVAVTGPRLDGRSELTAARAFYLDIAEWADDPARWGPWAVRCPVSASDASHKKDRSRRKSRTDARTRERLPVLPTLVSWAAAERGRTAELLAAAEPARSGQLFTAAGVTLRRTVMKTQPTGRVWAEDPVSGRRRDLSFEEHCGFCTWAVVEVLRHTGIRIEELTELSAPQPHPIPAAGHLGTDPAAADHPLQDRRRTAAGDLSRTRRRVVHHRQPDPRGSTRRATGGVLRQEANAAVVPMAAADSTTAQSLKPRCANISTTR